jgi:hypothetical protein
VLGKVLETTLRSAQGHHYLYLLLEKKCEHNGTVHQLFIDFKREVLCNMLLEFCITKNLLRIK